MPEGNLAMTTTERIKLLLELGEADQGRDWPDYLQYGFVERDVPALLDLVADEALDQASSDSAEVWAPLRGVRRKLPQKSRTDDFE